TLARRVAVGSRWAARRRLERRSDFAIDPSDELEPISAPGGPLGEAMGESFTHIDPEALLTHTAQLRALVRSPIPDRGRAADVLQGRGLAALSGPPHRPESTRAWLAAVARHLVHKLERRERRREHIERTGATREVVPATDAIVAREATRRVVVDAVLALDEPYRSTILLRYLDELPPRVIARRCGVPVETVRTRIKRGLELLRGRLVRW